MSAFDAVDGAHSAASKCNTGLKRWGIQEGERTADSGIDDMELKVLTNWRGHDDVMQTRSIRGSGKPAWVNASLNACFRLGPDPRIALWPAASLPHKQAGHMTASDQCCSNSESSCQGGANGMDPRPSSRSNVGRELQRGRIIMQVVRMRLDLAKYVFEVHGVDGQGNAVIRKTLRRGSVSTFFANLPPCLVGMEASNGAHYWARLLTELGHKVRLISPQFVAPYVKSNKNDRNDAEAICEAVSRPTMRFVPVKSTEQLAVQAVHRIRSRLVANRVRLVNQIRGLLGEHGIVVAQAIGNLRRALAGILDDDKNGLSKGQ